jgi:hypothetical protein
MTSDRDERKQPEAPSQQEAARIDVNQLSTIPNNEQETNEETNDNSDFVNEGARRVSHPKNTKMTASRVCCVP